MARLNTGWTAPHCGKNRCRPVSGLSLIHIFFKQIFEQIGKKLSKNVIGKSIPAIGGAIGALFDTAQMSAVLTYADIFYNKRYLAEKEVRISDLVGVVDISE